MPGETQNGSSVRDWLAVTMEEYKTLRQECLTSIQSQHSILDYGLAALGVIILAGVTARNFTVLPVIIFLIVVPWTSYFVLFTWFEEYARMVRAGSYIAETEKRINGMLKAQNPDLGDALSWESQLHNPRDNKNGLGFPPTCAMISAFFIGITAASLFIAYYENTRKAALSPWLFDILAIVVLLTTAITVLSFRKQIKRRSRICELRRP